MKKTYRPVTKRCEIEGCDEDVLPRESYCATHLREVERWR